MPAEQVAQLPMPGEVEFIMGGPPCQGYSGMNRYGQLRRDLPVLLNARSKVVHTNPA